MTDRQILLIHGDDCRRMAREVLEAANLAEELGDRSMRIGLKPNLVVAAPAEGGATTHPELVAGAIEYLQDHGFNRLEVLEGSWVGETTARALRANGLDKVCSRYNVPFYDLQKDDSVQVDAAGLPLRICRRATELDFLINLPVLKGHCQTVVTCALKNNKGLLPNSEKRRFHTMGLHRPIAHLAAAVPPSFCLVDNICGDLDFEEGGNPVVMNRVIGCKDPVLCDAFACQTMGRQTGEVDYIAMAEALGVGSADLEGAEVMALNEAEAAPMPPMTRRVEQLARYTQARDACSACYGSLIYALDRLRERGMLRNGLPPVAIGQGWRGEKAPEAIGVGNCCRGCGRWLPGCPPTSAEMAAFLEENWK